MGSAISTPLAISIAIPVLGGLLTSEATKDSLLNWYPGLNKPAWNPPGWLFGPVWTVLYTALGIAAHFVWAAPASPLRTRALTLYGIQLALNFLWPLVFFRAKRLGLSTLVNVALLVFSIGTQGAFYKVDVEAGQLLIPYIAWLAFANILNFTVWRFNPPNLDEVAERARKEEAARQEEKGPLGPEDNPRQPPAGATASMAPAPARFVRCVPPPARRSSAAPRLQRPCIGRSAVAAARVLPALRSLAPVATRAMAF